MSALEEFFEEGEALVCEADFVFGVGSIDEDVEMGAWDEGWFSGVAPACGVEVEAEDEVGLDGVVDEVGAGADLGGAVEELFGKLAEAGGVFSGGIGGEGAEIARAEGGDGVVGGADEGDGRAQFF